MDHDDNEKPHLHADEILLTCLLMMAPDSVKRLAVALLKGHVSIKTGEIAEEVIAEVNKLPSIIDFLDSCNEGDRLCPVLKGPKADSIEKVVEKLLEDIRSSSVLAILLDLKAPPPPPAEDPHKSEGAFIKAVPNCACENCVRVRDLEEKGLRLLKNGRTMPVDRIN